MSIDYQEKYLKYKKKYLELKKQIGGVIPCDDGEPLQFLWGSVWNHFNHYGLIPYFGFYTGKTQRYNTCNLWVWLHSANIAYDPDVHGNRNHIDVYAVDNNTIGFNVTYTVNNNEYIHNERIQVNNIQNFIQDYLQNGPNANMEIPNQIFNKLRELFHMVWNPMEINLA
jgi:hypothetical protein